MPRPQDIVPTYDQTIEKIMREASGPMSAQELAEKLLAARPSNAKDRSNRIKFGEERSIRESGIRSAGEKEYQAGCIQG